MVKLNKSDKKLWTEFRNNKRSKITRAEFQLLCTLHSKYLNHKYYEPCTCNPKTINKWIKELNEVYNES